MNTTFKKFLLVCVTIFAAAISAPLTTKTSDPVRLPVTLRCAIDLKDGPSDARTEKINRAILRQFAADRHLTLEVINPSDSTDYLDSLRNGTVDFLVTYRSDSLHNETFISTIPYRDSTVWVLLDGRREAARLLNSWIAETDKAGGFQRIDRQFRNREGYSDASLSHYDSLIKYNARKMGWDWRLLSAVIYHESRFVNQAHSNKGAVGLMQIRSTKYPIDTLLNPAANIAIGTRYLTRLSNMFAKHGVDSTECLKFTLAAYNAGEGTILKCIKKAEQLGVDASRWDNVVSIFPQMPDFSGKQTTAYVREILKTYDKYSEVYLR